MSHRRFYISAALILWLAFALRTYNLYSLPLYHDEGDHVRWAQFYELGTPTYPIFMDGKYLLGVTLAQMKVYGPESIWVSRAAVAIFSILACASSITIGKFLGGRPAALFAGLIYAVLPLAVFYERQIVADSLAAAYGAVAAALTLKLATSQQRRWVGPLAIALALSFLSKFFGLLFWAFPFFAIFVFATSRSRLFWNVRYYTLAIGLAVLVVGAFLYWKQPMLGYNNDLMSQQKVGHVTCPPLLCEGDAAKQIDNFTGAGRSLYEIASTYMGWPLVALAVLGLVLAPAERRRATWLVAIAEVSMVLALASAAYILPARYLPFLSLPVSVLAGAGIWGLLQLFRSKPLQWAAAAGVLALNIWPVSNTLTLISNPAIAAMPSQDHLNYITGSISGPGLLEAKQEITAREANSPIPPVLIIAQRWRDQFNATLVHFDVRQVKAVEGYLVSVRDAGTWLSTGTPVYVIDQVPSSYDAASDADGRYAGLVTEEIGRYPRENGEYVLRLLHIVGYEPEWLLKLFAEFFIRPNEIPSTFEALVDTLPASDDLALVVYPPSQIEILQPLLVDHPNISLYPIGNSWPLDIAATENELEHIAAQHSNIRVAFLGETIGDPTRQLETWLNAHLYRISETWLEPVRLIDFVGSSNSGQAIDSNIAFNDGITLESVNLLDSTAQANDFVRLHLEWKADAAITTQYKVFVHIFSGDRIIGQHDGQPVGELRPTTTWQPSETIVDQFAIQLPPDAPSGTYQLRIGLYDLATGARLPLASGEEFWVGGTLVIQ